MGSSLVHLTVGALGARTTYPYKYFGANVALLGWSNAGSLAGSRFGSPGSIATSYHATLIDLGELISRPSMGHGPQLGLNSGMWGTLMCLT